MEKTVDGRRSPWVEATTAVPTGCIDMRAAGGGSGFGDARTRSAHGEPRRFDAMPSAATANPERFTICFISRYTARRAEPSRLDASRGLDRTKES